MIERQKPTECLAEQRDNGYNCVFPLCNCGLPEIKFTISENPIVNKYFNDKQMIPHDHKIVTMIEDFDKWQATEALALLDEDNDNFEGEQDPEKRQAALEAFRKWRKEDKERSEAIKLLYKKLMALRLELDESIVNDIQETVDKVVSYFDNIK